MTYKLLPPMKPTGQYDSLEKYPVGYKAWGNRCGEYAGYHERLTDGSWSEWVAKHPENFEDWGPPKN